jgi:hypothetical protein
MNFSLQMVNYINVKVLPVTVAAPSEARDVFARSNTAIVGSNPAKGMDVFSTFILCCPV